MNWSYAAACAFALVACAPTSRPSPATAPSPAAELPEESAGTADSPTPREANRSAPDAPPGELACRTKTSLDGTVELYLEWNGPAGKGVLRRLAPSGMVDAQPVRAERYKGMIVADPPSSLDLVAHAATVREQNGKRYIRLGDQDQSWSACD